MKSGIKLVLALILSASFAFAASGSVTDMIVTGRVDDALKALNSRVQAAPNDAEAYHLLSRANFHLQKWDKAIEYGEKAVQLAPNNSLYYMWLGRAYGEKADDSGPFTAARLASKIRGNFEKADQLDSKNIDARSDLAIGGPGAGGVVWGPCAW